MGEEFQVGVSCGGNWWNLSKDFFDSSPCSPSNDMIMDIKVTRSSDESAGFSSSTIPEDWNQDLHHDSGRSEDNYSNNMSSGGETFDNSNSFKQVNGNYHLQQQHPLNSIDRLSPGYPLHSSSYNNYTSSLLQSLFDDDTYNQPMNISYSYYDEINNSNEFLPILPSTSSSVEQQPTANNHFPFTNNTGFHPSTQCQFLPSSFGTKKSSIPSVHVKKNEEARKLASHVVKKASNNEPAIKRARLQTPLTNFKVRKEKLGDRVTALQQLVSPFGKTDTASVLHEAIEYIKFLHDQVSVLSTPYMKNGSPLIQDLQAADKVKDEQVQDLKRRGLCLVPISSTFPVTAAETTTDFWTPIFGASFK